MSRFNRIATPIEDLLLIERQQIGDERGFFSRLFCREELTDFGATGAIAQINHTMTKAEGTVRGLHFQRPPFDEAKFVSCVAGAVFDIAVDMRPNSPTYLRWHGEVLSMENARSMMIPGGFAHGFQTLTDNCELIYLHDKPHTPMAEGGLNPLDPLLGIVWPLAVTQMSSRDAGFAYLTHDGS
ncbi:dTDP-4-dehydrorhamnose 3,5-epimerase family protein [Rhizobium tubonense]|uniref:dTDP-4-dehydrorhamnose 3,5-epimerase n=1 Tax=Rhizobium tubonense TaxID=484088 RepID=A0A2W4C7J0_9HYPH|nr:dTDP-4-dehydrorhamnose 3,5-epimerase family protein [Rhizobium tubonense]PZM07418.1 dTDP-4-dehydrorhamnose 3,5-epimerase [Rhizobium tubonense]